MKKPKKISEKELFNDGVKRLVVKTFKDGDSIYERPGIENAKSKYGTVVLALDKEKNIYFGKEFRFGPEKLIFNFCAGRHEEELSFEENALKELKEELGAAPKSISYLGECIVGGFDNGIVKCFIAEDCVFGKQELEENEDIKIYRSSIAEFEQKIVSGEINCPLTISCYTKAKLQNKI